MTVKAMRDWVMWFMGHQLGRKGRLKIGHKEERKQTKQRSLEMLLGSAFALGRLSIFMTKVSRRYSLLTPVAPLWLPDLALPSPPIIMEICRDWNDFYVQIP